MHYIDAMAGELDVEAIEKLGLLDGLEDAGRLERAELVAWLLDQGFTAEQVRAAASPMLLPASRVVGNYGTYVSAREISQAHGVDLQLLQRVQRALGLPRVDDPDAVVHLRADAEAAAGMQRFVEAGFDPDQLISTIRVLAEGLSRAAEVMRPTALSVALKPGLTELQVAQASDANVRQLLPLLGPMISDMLFVQLRHQVETEAVNVSERAAGRALAGAREVAVAFADVVGFTRMGEVLPAEDLERLASRLTDLTREIAVPPVRLVKTIGDAVMLVCPDPVKLLDAMLELSAASDTDSTFPTLRAGIASGSAVCRAGDWFGSPVNLASRITGVAPPGTVVVSESLRNTIADGGVFAWSFAGAHRLKNIRGETRVFQARRVQP
ncbi:MAG: adenylate/guanylate cyclase domain-containing protein [Mycobacterium sp.]